MKNLWIYGALALAAGGGYYALSQPKAEVQAQPTEFIMPELSELALAGETAYNASCVSCHGLNLAGTENGPSFLNRVYVAGHHADMAFVLAAKRGVVAHHWRFGNMPPQDQVSDEELGAIITYVREIQSANGL